MKLVELYTAGTLRGIPSFTNRGASAVLHGSENGLLDCACDDSAPSAVARHISVPVPSPMSAGNLAFSLLGVLLTTINATDAISQRFAWPTHNASRRKYAHAATKATTAWTGILNGAD